MLTHPQAFREQLGAGPVSPEGRGAFCVGRASAGDCKRDIGKAAWWQPSGFLSASLSRQGRLRVTELAPPCHQLSFPWSLHRCS